MKKLIILITIIALGLLSYTQKKSNSPPADQGQIKIEWIDKLTGDFSFQNKWHYPEGVYKNEFGQLSYDGLCPEETYAMKDSNGKIYHDSLGAFYQFVDTAHQFYSIQCEAWCYEWAGTDFIIVQQKNRDSVECYTIMNIATHCSLHFYITNEFCYPVIELNSITSIGSKTYKCVDGFIKIDKEHWKYGTMKAEFNFHFYNTENPGQPIYWKGKIFAKIEKQ